MCVAVTSDPLQNSGLWFLRFGIVEEITNKNSRIDGQDYWTVLEPPDSQTVVKSASCPLLFSFGDHTAETDSAETIGTPRDVRFILNMLEYSSVAEHPESLLNDFYEWWKPISVKFNNADFAEICPVRDARECSGSECELTGEENPFQELIFTYEFENGDLPQLSFSQITEGDVTIFYNSDTSAQFRYQYNDNAFVDAFDIIATTSQTGSYQEHVCSDHGICDEAIGDCNCFNGWGDSDRRG